MATREYPVRVTCSHGGCGRTQTYYPATRADEAETRAWQKRNPWKCNRHDDISANLRPGNETTRRVLVATRKGEHLYWIPEGGEHGSGFTHGPGFTAYATDFPEGTRLTVETRVEIPAEVPGD